VGEILPIASPKGMGNEIALLVGLGKKSDLSLNNLRRAAAQIYHWTQKSKTASLQIVLPGQLGKIEDEAQAAAEGFALASFTFDKHKSAKPSAKIPVKTAFVAPTANAASAAAGAKRGQIFAEAVNFAKNLINEPPSHKRPDVLAGVAQSLKNKNTTVKIFRKADLQKMGMNALLGVNRGSAWPPVLMHIHYKPRGKAKRKLAFIGKGITFDSGGLSLKTADGMMTMKYDMTGSASVMAVIAAVQKIAPQVEVHAIAPITENMPGCDAYKPGDVMKAYNGKTIEVLNTDAEGRIVLADALSYAAKLGADEMIDIATLTGAAAISLGRGYAALMTNRPELETAIKRAADQAGEKLWPLPLEKTYKDHIRSLVADIKNIGNPGEAGTIIGGLFLEEFVDDRPWIHLDIAACGWNAQDSTYGAPGATGVMIRTMLHHVLNNDR
jgi:leucyl aminopeptidase